MRAAQKGFQPGAARVGKLLQVIDREVADVRGFVDGIQAWCFKVSIHDLLPGLITTLSVSLRIIDLSASSVSSMGRSHDNSM